jgi:hypothetical protein
MSPHWYYASQSQRRGPVPDDQLKLLVATVTIKLAFVGYFSDSVRDLANGFTLAGPLYGKLSSRWQAGPAILRRSPTGTVILTSFAA